MPLNVGSTSLMNECTTFTWKYASRSASAELLASHVMSTVAGSETVAESQKPPRPVPAARRSRARPGPARRGDAREPASERRTEPQRDARLVAIGAEHQEPAAFAHAKFPVREQHLHTADRLAIAHIP